MDQVVDKLEGPVYLRGTVTKEVPQLYTALLETAKRVMYHHMRALCTFCLFLTVRVSGAQHTLLT